MVCIRRLRLTVMLAYLCYPVPVERSSSPKETHGLRTSGPLPESWLEVCWLSVAAVWIVIGLTVGLEAYSTRAMSITAPTPWLLPCRKPVANTIISCYGVATLLGTLLPQNSTARNNQR